MISCVPATQLCGNGVVDSGEACDRGTDNGVSSCSARCGSAELRCGVNVPRDLPADAVVVTLDEVNDVGNTCATTLAEALMADPPASAIYFAPGIHDVDLSNEITVSISGAGESKTRLEGSLAIDSDAEVRLRDLTIQASTPNASFPPLAIQSNVTLDHVTLDGNNIATRLLTYNGGADAINLIGSTLIGGGVLFGTLGTNTNISVRDTAFRRASLVVSGANDLQVRSSCFLNSDVLNIDTNDNVALEGNRFGGAACGVGPNDSARALRLGDGAYTIRNSVFFGRGNCTSIEILGQNIPNADSFRLEGNRFLPGSGRDLEVNGDIEVESSDNRWSISPDPCQGMTLLNGATVAGDVNCP